MAHVLVVEDDALVREMVRVVLESAGHTVAEAGNGAAALVLLTGRPVDLMIADIMMPVLDGIGLILEVRRQYPALRVLCVSGGSCTLSIDYLPAARKLGADMCLAKPFGPKQLLAAVDDLLRLPRGHGAQGNDGPGHGA